MIAPSLETCIYAAFLGTALHKKKGVDYKKQGGHVEESHFLYLHQVASVSVGDILLGTPDMWRVKDKTLTIVDLKSLPEGSERGEGGGITQLLLYAYLLLYHLSAEKIEVNQVILENGTYGRMITNEDSKAKRNTYRHQLSPSEVIKRADNFLSQRFQRKLKGSYKAKVEVKK